MCVDWADDGADLSRWSPDQGVGNVMPAGSNFANTILYSAEPF